MSGGAVAAGLAPAALRGVAWSLLATAAARLLTLGSLVLLARLLGPAEFGLLAFALVFVTYAETIGDLGTTGALIYWPEKTDEAARVTFGVNVALGFGWLGVTLFVAPFVAAFFGNPAGEDILRALAWGFPLKYLGNTHDALCQKTLSFRARMVPEVGMAAVKAAVSVALAAAGLGVWSLVWGQLLGQAAWTLLLWVVVPWRPRGPWPSGLVGPMLAYGRGVVAVNLLAAVTHHADLVVVGRMLGAVPLGLYQMAAKVPETTVTLLLWVTSRVLFPTFARLWAHGGRLDEGYLTASRYVSLLSLPAAAGLFVLAEPLVLVAFGETWRASTPVLRGLALFVAARSLSTPAGDVLKAMGRPGLLAGLGLLRALVLVPALVVAAPSGAATVAFALAAVTGGFMALNVAVVCRLNRISPAAFARALGPSVLATFALVLALLACAKVATDHPPTLVVLSALLGGAAHLAAFRIASPQGWHEVIAGLRTARASATPPPDELVHAGEP